MPFIPGRCLLKRQLKQAKMTQKQLAKRLNKSEQRISDYVNSRVQMSLGTCKTVAEILNCSIEDLYEWIYVPHVPRKNRHRKE